MCEWLCILADRYVTELSVLASEPRLYEEGNGSVFRAEFQIQKPRYNPCVYPDKNLGLSLANPGRHNHMPSS